jgi:hypothetical protein
MLLIWLLLKYCYIRSDRKIEMRMKLFPLVGARRQGRRNYSESRVSSITRRIIMRKFKVFEERGNPKKMVADSH